MLDVNIPDLPRAKTIFFDVEIKEAGKFERDDSTAALGKDLTFQYEQLQGAQVKLRLLPTKVPNQLQFRVTPQFAEGRLEYEFTRDKLKDMAEVWTKQGREAANKLAQIKRDLARMNAQLRQLQSSSGSDSIEQSNIASGIAALNNNIAAKATGVRTQEKRVVEMSARLKAMPTIEKFMSAHHGKDTIRFHVYAQVAADRISLIECQ